MASSQPDAGASARSRIAWRLLPFLFLLYVANYLDRTNIAYATLGMKGDVGLTDSVFGTASGIFFIGYIGLQIPGALLVERWSARKLLALTLITWGALTGLTGFVHTPHQLYGARFLLGAAEAGFFPGVIVYLSHWFRYQDRAKAVAMFMAAIPVSNIFGGPLSGWILGVNWLGLAGWRWVFIIEGFPAVILGIITIFYLTDRPKDAKWLAEDERAWISAELEREKEFKKSKRTFSIWEAFRHRNVLLLAAGYFCAVTSAYGFNFWLPTILKGLSDYSNLQVSVISALPYCAGLLAMLVIGWSSDRTRERRWHTAFSLLAVSAGLFLSAIAAENAIPAIMFFCLAGAGLYAYLPGFWAIPAAFLTESAAAASIGLINSVGNLGGFVGPYIVGYLNNKTNSFYAPIIYLSCSALAAAILILLVQHSAKTSEP